MVSSKTSSERAMDANKIPAAKKETDSRTTLIARRVYFTMISEPPLLSPDQWEFITSSLPWQLTQGLPPEASQTTPVSEFLFTICPVVQVSHSDVQAGPGYHPPFPAIRTPEWVNKANKIKGTGQATLTTKIERLTTVKVTDVWILGDEK